ncbi:MAG: histidine ammonia-lyase [Cloacibacillus porcorum]|uniref:histidine ammonia-lyase n=1 Tax=Cloacibacillus porcorum TaxID=1197717 RepID=UPI002354DE01|nr:histidine ammonia-lyase [Cloacibacillus porcorum]MCI5863942.1 histidine ammonia-lyase [Cloacibacillus porcorum]MDD7649533.1 histidine ammonia-lyase [Cloacibacillus porcorum]MDY4093950.1 histidine ammonia-lyase [Cloacibacillus porcorum]
MTTVHLDGKSLTLQDVVNVARKGYKVEIAPAAKEQIKECAASVSEWVKEGRVVYGITTGFGDLASVVIPRDKGRQLQENLLLSHACGYGEPYPEDVVRAIMLLRINTLTRGFSGISLETLQQMVDYLNLGIHPVVPTQGSVGASGDLCPLSHVAISLIGHGEVVYKGQKMSASEALAKVGMKPVELQPKEGLALNNGTTVMNAVAALCIVDAMNMMKNADVAASMSAEALHAVPYAFDRRTHDLRPQVGQGVVAENIRRLIEGSEIIEAFKKDRVQDAYSLRCLPQVHGASRDAIGYVKEKVEIEINSVTDNPIIFHKDGDAISGGNFHGQPMAMAMDFFGIAAAEFASISERRVARLVDHKLSDLPPFLVSDSGVNSGFMIPQYTAAAIVSENKVLAHPSVVDSIPTSANQEDHVSMGGYSARKGRQILDNTNRVIAVEMVNAAQGMDFRAPLKPGKGSGAAFKEFRKHVPFYEKDQFMQPLLLKSLELVENGTVVKAVEEAIGELK